MTATDQTSRPARRTTTVVACTALIAALGGAPASADRPLFQDHVQEHHDLHEVPPLTAACACEAWHEERFNVVLRVFEDGTEELRLPVHETLVTPSSDEVLEHHLAGSHTRHSSEQLARNLLVIDQNVRHTGLPSIVHGPHPELAMTEEEFTEFVCKALN